MNILLNRGVTKVAKDQVETNCTFTDARTPIECDGVLMVSSKLENGKIYHDLKSKEDHWVDAGIKSVKIIGDAQAPGPIAWATYAGHRYARELDTPEIGDEPPFRREVTELGAWP